MRTVLISLFVILAALQLYAVYVWGAIWIRERHPLAFALVLVSGTFIVLILIRGIENQTGADLRVLAWITFASFSITHFAMARGWISRAKRSPRGNQTKDVESRGEGS